MARSALIFSYVWPETRSSAAGLRTRELIDFLLEESWNLNVASPSNESPYRRELENIGIATIQCDPNNSVAFQELRALNPELVIYDRFVMEEQFGWRVRELWPNAIEVVDTQDFHSLRRLREKTSKTISGVPLFEEPNWQNFDEDLLRELASLHRAGAAMVVSEFEERLLLQSLEFPADRLLLLPFSSDPSPFRSSFFERNGFCFLGNFRHPPNLDCVRYILAHIWPGIRKELPEAELHLYGAYPPAEISWHKGKNGIFSHGHVMDHRKAITRHRAMLSPLRFGAGIKGKVLESWGTGTPVIGTWLTFEGMGEAGILGNDADSLISLSVRLHQNETLWLEEQNRGLQNLELRFSRKRLKARFLQFLKNLPPVNSHLTGAMLRHQHSNSLKYFSRWIEAKSSKAIARHGED